MNQGGGLLATNPALAQRLIGKGLMLEPDQAIGWFNLGIGLHQQRKISAAIKAYKRCLSLPHSAETGIATRNNLSQDLLLQGEWKLGWFLYNQRFKRKPGNYPIFAEAFGAAHVAVPNRERPVLLMSEQGLGDTLQFVRYALALQHEGVDVTVLSQSPLVGLLRDSVGLHQVDDCLDLEEQQKRNPVWLPLMNLGPLMGCINDKIPLTGGYVKASADSIARWRHKLKRKPEHLLIALHWQGNPDHEHSLYSRGRSLPFREWLGLQGIDKVEFVSIQKGQASDQLKTDQGLDFVSGQKAVSKSMDFCDTAAVIANCDLVISSDSSVAHLAGAMGIPTWVALRWIPEWRWGLEGTSTDWYSSLKLFRQRFDGDWTGVVQTMKKELEQIPLRRRE
ncbi:tetratricopeptide repeat protein [Synechococcus sp. MU1642]|uniref:tetratricopeptide repeat protein n=1 Tax=Synechococcus sp. MU1642 TaxID=2508348 RepID=UPI001CF83FC8|nr:tetratricopeptide repeat protein [Synechococcus sp. MU1642]